MESLARTRCNPSATHGIGAHLGSWHSTPPRSCPSCGRFTCGCEPHGRTPRYEVDEGVSYIALVVDTIPYPSAPNIPCLGSWHSRLPPPCPIGGQSTCGCESHGRTPGHEIDEGVSHTALAVEIYPNVHEVIPASENSIQDSLDVKVPQLCLGCRAPSPPWSGNLGCQSKTESYPPCRTVPTIRFSSKNRRL